MQDISLFNARQPLRWIDQPRKLPVVRGVFATENIRQLDERYEELSDEMVALLPVPPLAHQRRTIRAMMDLESIRCLKINNYTIQTNAGILSERPGSGKSYEILALIQLAPRLSPARLIRAVDPHTENGFRTDVYSKSAIVTYSPKMMLNINIIFAAKNVINQWREYITLYAGNIKYLTVEKFHDLRDLDAMLKNDMKAFKKYGILLVKHSTVSSTTMRNIYPEATGEGAAMIDVIQYMFRDYMVNRVIIDDFDVINTYNVGGVISANFTWLVSATNNSSARRRNTSVINTYNAAAVNPLLFQYMNISCTEAFINRSTRQSNITHKVYKFSAPNLQMRTAIDLLDTDIAELVNGDAITLASRALKISKENPNITDVFAKLYTTEYNKLVRAKKTQVSFAEMMEKYNKLPEYKPRSKITYKLSNLSDILDKNDFAKFISCIPTKNPEVDAMLVTYNDTLEANIMGLQGKIDRIIEGFQEGECPITAEPLNNTIVAIMRCCAMVFNSEALKIIDVTRGCPNCMANPNNLDYMLLNNSGIDFSVRDVDPNLEELGESNENARDTYSIDDLLSLADGVALGDTVYNNPDVDSAPLSKEHSVLRLMLLQEHRATGTTFKEEIYTDLGVPQLSDRKWLIFCGDNHVVRTIISTGFSRYNVRYGIVSGRSNTIYDYIARYKMPASDPRSINVLLITTRNGNSAFAGLDLQITTDIIFMNKYVNPNLQRQMIGRANRIGRNSNLLVHYFCYENELRYIDLPDDSDEDDS